MPIGLHGDDAVSAEGAQLRVQKRQPFPLYERYRMSSGGSALQLQPQEGVLAINGGVEHFPGTFFLPSWDLRYASTAGLSTRAYITNKNWQVFSRSHHQYARPDQPQGSSHCLGFSKISLQTGPNGQGGGLPLVDDDDSKHCTKR